MGARPSGTVTFMFSDIEGSTRRWEHDPDGMRHALEAHDRTMRNAIGLHNGFVFATGGDGFAVAFARADDALGCAVEAQRALQRDGAVRVRMAVHTGEADERDGNYFGPAVNRAARLMALAHGEQVLVSATTERIAAGYELLDLGEHRLRDLERAEHVHQLAAEGLRAEFPPLRGSTSRTESTDRARTARIGNRPAVSAREAEVLTLLGERLTNPQIAQRLFVSVRTVESHVSSLLRKLGAADRRELADLAAGTPVAPSSDAPALVGVGEQLTAFVGRDDELRVLADALATHRLVTLTGPGGMGKTRLSIEAARAAPRPRAWFVDLVPADGATVITTVATTIGVGELPNQSIESAVHGRLAEEPTLLVLDNCEHVLGTAATLAERAVTACPTLVVLATSREPLAVQGERVVALGPLALDADNGAVALFEARARDAGAVIDGSARGAIEQIVAGLDGIPLAIELAAARAASLGVDGVVAALGDRMRLLSGGRRVDERHRSLRAVLDWSHDLLDDEERVLLRRLSVFHHRFNVDDARAITDEDAMTVLDTVGRLAAKSLVVAAITGAGARYRMLETIREYATERLDASGETDAIRTRHARWAHALGRTMVATLDAEDALDPHAEGAADDLRDALDWFVAHGHDSEAHDLARAVARLAYVRGYPSEAQQRFEDAAALAATPVERAVDLFDAAHSAFAVLRGDVGFERFVAAGELAASAGESRLAVRAFGLAAERAFRFAAEFPQVAAVERVHELLALAQRQAEGDDDPAVLAQIAVTQAWLSTGTPSTSTMTAAEAAANAARRSGDPTLLSSALDALSAARWASHLFRESVDTTVARLALLDEMHVTDPRSGGEQLDILHMVCDTQLAIGDLADALHSAQVGAQHPLSQGALHVINRELVIALFFTGRFDDALVHAETMRAVWEGAGRPSAGWMAPAAFSITLLYGVRGDDARHAEWRALSEAVCLSSSNPMRGFADARLALHRGDLDAATRVVDAELSQRPPRDGTFPWSAAAIGYEPYFFAVAAEIDAGTGTPDFDERVASLRETYAEQRWVRAAVHRAVGRRTGDEVELRAAVALFDEIDARFEAAVTMILLGGRDAEEGKRSLDALGCTQPA